MRQLSALLFGLLLLLPLKSCQVPDIKPFATATVEMTTAVGTGYDLVLDDVNNTLKLDLTASRRQALRQLRDTLAKRLRVNRQALAVLNTYANTLVEVSEAGEKGEASLNKIATALAGVTTAFNPIAGVAGGLFKDGIALIAKDVKRIGTLKRLDRAMNAADSAVHKTADLLGANNRDIARLDSAAADIINAQLTGTNQNVLQAYDNLALRAGRADSAAALIVEFEATAVAYAESKVPARRPRYQQRLSQLLLQLARLDPAATQFFQPSASPLSPFPPDLLPPTLKLLAKREAFWRQRADYSISDPFQARYDRVQAELAANTLRTRQHRVALQKGTDLIRIWATSHTTLKRAVTSQKHAVSFQEVVAAARQLKDYVDKISTAF